MEPSLAARLRHETEDCHRRAERAGVMAELLAGRVDARAYRSLLRNLLPVYQALEADAVPACRPLRSRLRLDEVARVPALTDDLFHLHGPAWESDLSVTDAAQRYAARIHAAETTSPPRFAAHAYVRYLGDLSGGQALGRLVGRSLGLRDGVGLAFYRFAVGDIAQFKREFRAGLDALPLDRAGQDEVVEEARRAFDLNVALFEALATQTPSSAEPARRHAT
jgi:heme oxygenase